MTASTSATTIRRNRIVAGSCWHCRRRRLKCDLARPNCAQCLEKAQTCSYSTIPPIKWVGGAASKGRMAGCLSPTRAVSPTAHLSAAPSIMPMDKGEVLMYFMNAVLPRFQILEQPIQFNVDFVLQNDALQHAVVAVSQAHFALNSKVDVYDIEMVRRRARQSAIKGFRECLAYDVQSESSAQRLFAINILLCILDGMIEPSEELNAGTCHLRGGFAMLNAWTNTPTRMLLQDGIQAHLLSIYATMDLVHALLSGNKPFFESLIWKMFADVQTWFGCLNPDDRLLQILAAFSDSAALGHLVCNNFHFRNTPSLVEKCIPSIEDIFNFPGTYEDCFVRDEQTLEPSWKLFCSIYEVCGYIYLQRALRLRSSDDKTVQAAVRRGVEKLTAETLPPMMRHCLVFPILVIGSHCSTAHDRDAIMKVLSPSCSYLSFGNMKLMTDFLRSMWTDKQRDSNQTWWQCFSSVSQKAFLF